jgi:hypothetical protein
MQQTFWQVIPDTSCSEREYTMHAMTLDSIRTAAPSVFATEPWERMSERYRFFPTSDIVVGLMDNGFLPVRAQQSRSRIPGKEDYTRHMLRFRQAHLLDSARETEVPEIVLLNSHDGTATYQISLGLFRVQCTNGLVVKSAGIEDIRVRHSGRTNLIDDVIEATYTVIQQAPTVLEQVETWKHLQLSPPEQEILADAALEVRETALTIPVQEVLRARRAGEGYSDAPRNAWMTMNVVQENLTRGGVLGSNTQGQRRRLRGITSVDGDTKMNRALWLLTERMAALKA